MCLCAREEQALCLGDELFRPGGSVLALLGLVLLVMWLLGFVAFHVTTGVIHILLVLAVISFLLSFFGGSTGGRHARRPPGSWIRFLGRAARALLAPFRFLQPQPGRAGGRLTRGFHC